MRFKVIALSGLVAGAALFGNGCVMDRLWNWFDFAACWIRILREKLGGQTSPARADPLRSWAEILSVLSAFA